MKSVLLLILSVSALHGAAVTYTSLPYRGRADSPFYSSIQVGTTLVEDFEDEMLNTPGISFPRGRVSSTGRHRVDEDDGRMDNLGVGFHWQVDSGNLPGETLFIIDLRFAQDSNGKYPTHAGLAFLGFAPSDLGARRYFQAYDSNGIVIPDSFLTAAVPIYRNQTTSVATVGDRFFGLGYEAGISKILTSSSRIDHIQFGYGPVPEPGSAGLLLAALAGVGLTRRRTSVR